MLRHLLRSAVDHIPIIRWVFEELEMQVCPTTVCGDSHTNFRFGPMSVECV
jgi:hypothetical protein